MNKKVVALWAILLCLLLTACGSTNEDADSQTYATSINIFDVGQVYEFGQLETLAEGLGDEELNVDYTLGYIDCMLNDTATFSDLKLSAQEDFMTSLPESFTAAFGEYVEARKAFLAASREAAASGEIPAEYLELLPELKSEINRTSGYRMSAGELENYAAAVSNLTELLNEATEALEGGAEPTVSTEELGAESDPRYDRDPERVQERIDYFNGMTESLGEEFAYGNFVAVTSNLAFVTLMPEGYEKISELSIPTDMQKLYIYTDSDTGTTVILQAHHGAVARQNGWGVAQQLILYPEPV